MRLIAIVTLCFAALLSAAQNVVKERMIAWSITGTTGDVIQCLYDSAAVHYPQRDSKNGFEIINGNIKTELWESGFDSISYYSCQINKILPEFTQCVYRNKIKSEMLMLNLSSTGDSLFMEKREYVKDSNKVTKYESWSDFGDKNFRKSGFSYTNWDNKNFVTDSSVYFSPTDTTILLTEYNYLDGKFVFKKQSTYLGFPLIDPAVYIDSYANGLHQIERYDLINGMKTNHTLEKRIGTSNNHSNLTV